MGKKSRSKAAADAPPTPPPGLDPDMAARLADLTPEQADMFTRALALALRKRRVLLLGYALTAVALFLGVVWALYIYGKTLGSGESMIWVFFIPPALAAIILITFGRISRSLR